MWLLQYGEKCKVGVKVPNTVLDLQHIRRLWTVCKAYCIQIMNVYESSGTIFSWGERRNDPFNELNGTFHLSPNENICFIARMRNIHFFYMTAKYFYFIKRKLVMFSPIHFVVTVANCRLMHTKVTRALCICLRTHDQVCDCVFWYQKRNPAMVHDVWDQKCTANGTKMHGRWGSSLNRANN